MPKGIAWYKVVQEVGLEVLGKQKPQASFPDASGVINRLLESVWFKYYT